MNSFVLDAQTLRNDSANTKRSLPIDARPTTAHELVVAYRWKSLVESRNAAFVLKNDHQHSEKNDHNQGQGDHDSHPVTILDIGGTPVSLLATL